MRFLVVIIMIISFIPTVHAETNPDYEINVIELDYESYNFNGFSEGLAAVRKSDKWGFIDKSGKEVIKFSDYDQVGDFNDGLAGVWKNKKWGFIDKTGKEVIVPQYEAYKKVNDESFIRVKMNNKWGYIDKTGYEVVTPQYDEITDITIGGSESLRAAYLNRVKKDGKWGYIDKTGYEVIPPQYDDARFFSNGYSVVRKDDSWLLIDNVGNEIMELPLYDDYRNFNEDRLAFQKDEKWGYLDGLGKEVIKPQYDVADDFEGGIARVVKGPGQIGFIDKSNHVVIKLQHANITDNSEGIVALFTYTTMGLFNTKEPEKKVVMVPYKGLGGDMHDGLIIVVKDNKRGLINREGIEIIPPQYDGFWEFSDGLARVQKDNKYGLVDKTGNEVVELKYDRVTPFHEGVAFAREGKKMYLININFLN